MNTCDICGKPRGAYPNWILTYGRQMHLGCLAEAFERLLTAAKALEESLGADEEASMNHMLDGHETEDCTLCRLREVLRWIGNAAADRETT